MLGDKKIGVYTDTRGLHLKYDANKTIKVIELESFFKKDKKRLETYKNL